MVQSPNSVAETAKITCAGDPKIAPSNSGLCTIKVFPLWASVLTQVGSFQPLDVGLLADEARIYKWDEDHVETEEELLAKQRFMHPED